jgi:hypothetical protein
MASDFCKRCDKKEAYELSENVLELISQITEFNETHEFMQDEDLDKTLAIVVKLIVRAGEVQPQSVPPLIVELQALSTKFAILASYYANMGKSGVRETHKKNMYYTLKEALPKLADALKYQVKTGMNY